MKHLASLMIALSVACAAEAVPDVEGDRARLLAQVSELEQAVQAARTAEAGSAAMLTQLEASLQATRARLESLNTARRDEVGPTVARVEGELEALRALVATLGGGLRLEVPFRCNGQPLVLDQGCAVNGGTVRLSEVRYWLSNVELVRADGTVVTVPNSYYLVDQRKAQTVSNGTANVVTLPARTRTTVEVRDVPAGVYTGMRFHIGVEPTHNNDLSLPGGELHVLQNMTFDNGWMWFTSYIFAKTQGVFVDGAGEATFRWDTGSNADYRALATVTLPAPLTVAAGKQPTIAMAAEVTGLFAQLAPRAYPLISAEHGAARTTLANAYASMFRLLDVRP